MKSLIKLLYAFIPLVPITSANAEFLLANAEYNGGYSFVRWYYTEGTVKKEGYNLETMFQYPENIKYTIAVDCTSKTMSNASLGFPERWYSPSEKIDREVFMAVCSRKAKNNIIIHEDDYRYLLEPSRKLLEDAKPFFSWGR